MILSARLSKHHKLVSVSLLGASLLVLAIVVAWPIAASIAEARELVASETERLASLRARRADLAELEAALKAIRAKAGEQPLILEAPSTAAAWDKLEAAVREIASTQDATIGSTRMLRLEDDSGLKAIRGEIDLSVAKERLFKLVVAVEGHAPPVFIEKLRLTSSRGQESDGRVQFTASLRMLAAIGAPGPAR